ncbi:MAG: chorismate synthase [Hymenobacteraceae bacterium]|nr:chorismate synthase [Hymenobacteraceae bacterium]
MNTFGTHFRLTTFGESHGVGVGGIVDGCPAGLTLTVAEIQAALDRRRPGQSHLTTPRQEADQVEILSGVYEGRTLGTPIAFVVRNEDHHSADYGAIAAGALRPGHADFTWRLKYGHVDPRGGGRSSARETLARVAGGAIAAALLRQWGGVEVRAWVSSVAEVDLTVPDEALDLGLIEATPVRCPDPATAARMIARIEAARAARDSVGGIITGVATGLPVGLGEPVFGKLPALLGAAMLGINAVKGFEIGDGFAATRLPGSAHNDAFVFDETLGRVRPATNHAGGVLGGLSSGEPVRWRVAFKPVATLPRETPTLTTAGEETVIPAKGRHDPCVLPRAVPIVEAMAALVLADLWLAKRDV